MNDQKFQITHITEDQIPLAGAVLEQAFSGDPLNVYTCPDPAERTRVFSWLFTAMVRTNAHLQSVYITGENLNGVAVWLPPHASKRTAEESRLLDGLDQMSIQFGLAAYERFSSVFSYFEPLHKETIQGRHWYLSLLGVAPRQQGQGIGGALLAPVLHQADTEGLPCYLETFVPKNVSFYQHRGFQIAATTLEPRSQIPCWIMRREPRHS